MTNPTIPRGNKTTPPVNPVSAESDVLVTERRDMAATKTGGTALSSTVIRPASPADMRPKQPQTTPEALFSKDLRTAFDTALQFFTKTTTEPNFLAYCQKNAVDPHRKPRGAEYWEQFRNYSIPSIKRLKEQANDNLNFRCLELLIHTPDFIFTQEALNRGNFTSNQAKGAAKDKAIAYNSLIRKLAIDFKKPESQVLARDISRGLVSVANVALEQPHAKTQAGKTINNAILGAQYEVASGQLLDRSGILYREATDVEDRIGADYMLRFRGKEICLDIKASTAAISSETGQPIYTTGYTGAPNISTNGIRQTEPAFGLVPIRPGIQKPGIILFPGDLHTVLDGRFFLPDGFVQEKAPDIGRTLKTALMALG